MSNSQDRPNIPWRLRLNEVEEPAPVSNSQDPNAPWRLQLHKPVPPSPWVKPPLWVKALLVTVVLVTVVLVTMVYTFIFKPELSPSSSTLMSWNMLYFTLWGALGLWGMVQQLKVKLPTWDKALLAMTGVPVAVVSLILVQLTVLLGISYFKIELPASLSFAISIWNSLNYTFFAALLTVSVLWMLIRVRTKDI